jgi:hypothetical protein
MRVDRVHSDLRNLDLAVGKIAFRDAAEPPESRKPRTDTGSSKDSMALLSGVGLVEVEPNLAHKPFPRTVVGGFP